MSKSLLSLISLVFVFPIPSFAFGKPTIQGNVVNDTPWAFSEMKLEIKWIYKCGFGDGIRICDQTQGEARLNENGSYSASVKTGSTGLFGKEYYRLNFLLPNGKAHTVEFEDKLPKSQDLFMKFIKGTVLNTQLPDGTPAAKWLNDVAPASQLAYNFEVTNESTGKQILWVQKTLTGAPLAIEDLTWITTTDLQVTRFRFSETVDAAFFSGGYKAPQLFRRQSSGILSQNSFGQRLGPIVLDVDKLNTNLSGQWNELLLLHELGSEVGFAVANTRLALDLNCQQGVLSGTGQHYHFQNQNDSCDDLKSCDEKKSKSFKFTARAPRAEANLVMSLN